MRSNRIIPKMIILIINIFTLSFLVTSLYIIYCTTNILHIYIDHSLIFNNWLEYINISSIHKDDFILLSFSTITTPIFKFYPLYMNYIVPVDQTFLIPFKIINLDNQAHSIIISYNILPSFNSPYFIKNLCFCFEEQRLAPFDNLDWDLSFFIHPDILINGSYHLNVIYNLLLLS